MNYCNIKTRDIANGIGVRVTLFVSGCRNHCKNCFQPETWDFNYGDPFIREVEDQIIEELRPDFVDGLTLLGGEPGEAENQRGLLPFLRRVREELPDKTIWCYSGFTWEQLTGKEPARCRCEVTDEFLSQLDVLVDGPFVEELHDITLLFRGSANQRLIDVPKTLETGEVTIWQRGPIL